MDKSDFLKTVETMHTFAVALNKLNTCKGEVTLTEDEADSLIFGIQLLRRAV